MQPGSVFEGRYRIERVLGEGGFSTVYAATDVGVGRLVALKVIKADPQGPDDPMTRARFRREVQIVGKLRDPHTVTLFDHGETAAGLLYMVFEHVPGEDLSTLLERRGRLEPGEVRHIIEQLLTALAEAHRAGMLHRDIKPQNIRVYESMGDPLFVKLLDFGIARSSDHGSPSMTKTGELVGTPRYMSPEQLTAKPLSASSDIYSVGMLAYELLMGADALGGNRWGEQLDRLRTGHVFSVPEFEIGDGLLQVIQRMTARNEADRYQNVALVLRDLRSEAPVAVTAPISPPREPASAPAGSRAIAVGVVSLAVFLLVALGVIYQFLLGGEAVESPQSVIAVPNALVKTSVPASPPAVPPAPDAAREDADVVEPERSLRSKGCGADPSRIKDDMFGVATFLPSDYDPEFPHPLLILLHSDYQDPSSLATHGGFAALADAERLIVIAPADRTGTNAWRSEEADEAIVRLAAAGALEVMCVDRSRVYVVGHGDGARISIPLSCEAWVTAVVAHGHGRNATNRLPRCRRPKPTLWVTPTRSPHIPLDGSENCSGNVKLKRNEIDAYWKARNACAGEREIWFSQGESECETWKCDRTYVSCLVDGGRDWPGTPTSEAPGFLKTFSNCPTDTSTDFPTTEQVWRFLRESPPLAEPPEVLK